MEKAIGFFQDKTYFFLEAGSSTFLETFVPSTKRHGVTFQNLLCLHNSFASCKESTKACRWLQTIDWEALRLPLIGGFGLKVCGLWRHRLYNSVVTDWNKIHGVRGYQ